MKHLINPPTLAKPSGYTHAIATEGGRTVYLSGQVAFGQDTSGDGATVLFAGDLTKQFEQAIANLQVAVRAAGGELTDFVKMTIFVRDKKEYKRLLKPIGAVYLKYFGKHFPAMTLVEVSDLFEDAALIEIEAIAVIN